MIDGFPKYGFLVKEFSGIMPPKGGNLRHKASFYVFRGILFQNIHASIELYILHKSLLANHFQ